MAASTSFPTTVAGQVAFAANMADKASLPAYELPLPLVAEVEVAAGQLQAAATAAANPDTRTKSAIALRDQRIREFRTLAGRVVKVVRANPALTAGQLEDLGVKPLAVRRKQIPAPTVSPVVTISRVDGRTVHMELRRDARGRGKPKDVAGAVVFTHVGPTAPTSSAEWTFAGSTTRTTFDLAFGPSETGDTVWITAFWQNARDVSGPASQPISVRLPAGGAMPQEMEDAEPMKIAA